MKSRSMTARHIAVIGYGAMMILLLVPTWGTAQSIVYLGLDRNGDTLCDGSSDMNATGVTIGDPVSFQVWWDAPNDGAIAIGCTFCTDDSAKVNRASELWTPSSEVLNHHWTVSTIRNSIDDPSGVPVSPWIGVNPILS